MRLSFLIATVSAAILGYEIALMRALSVSGWYHFAYMIVSLALLGFGASGTLISLLRRFLFRHVEAWLTLFAAAFAVSVPVSFALAQQVPFNVFELGWDARQYLYLFEYYLILSVPFLLGATVIGVALVHRAEQSHRVYFWNLMGSGLGAGGMVALMFALPPAQLPLAVFALAAVASVLHGARCHWPSGLGALGVTAATALFFTSIHPLEIQVSERKLLSDLLREPEARVLESRHSPLGVVDVAESPTVRLTAGVSLAYTGDLPKQRALVVDAGSASAINHLTHPDQLKAFDYTTSALPYHLLERPRTLIVGAGGGSDVLLARTHDCPSITALEIDPNVADLMLGSQASFAQHVFEQPGVALVLDEARGYLARTRERFDLIQLPLVESFAVASAGVYALSESYLYTVEAVEAFLGHLTPPGILCITRWAKTPPADPIRIFATVTEAFARRGVREVGRHVLFIRSWSTATVLASPSAFTQEQLAALRRFCRERSFDLVWAPDLQPSETNQYHVLQERYYEEAAARLLSAERREFLRSCPFDLTPTTDDRPYHALSVRWRGLRHLRSTMGDRWVSFVDWGYVVLVATVVQAAVAGVVLIILPLLFLRREHAPRGSRVRTFLYFACLGLAYMFIELVMMQKLSLFLASPIYAAALVLTSFMLFSGLGSLTAGRLLDGERRAARLGIVGIVVVGLLLWLGMDSVLGALAGGAWWLRVPAAAACAGSLAFFMGMPFPSGLRHLARHAPALTPWAWGVNGCASVVGAALTPLLSVSFGFRLTLLFAFALYALAACVLSERVSTTP
jgi:spermidine synthase